ncbi:MAG: anaerobic ribonucleoside triphosphate reductase [Firmicutes bacterium]|nr:anaerobic ribonucleoside triphosphate reductase [Bacillota bacterium]
MQSIINGVRVTCVEDITEPEATEYANDEIKLWAAKGKELSSIFITLDGEEVVIEAKEKSPIRRVRRITGYLSEVNSFNDAKRSELADRVSHVKI